MNDSLPSPFTFCPNCGQKGIQLLRQHEFRCPDCGFRYFHNVATAVGALILKDGKALCIERGMEPAKGKLGLVGGFVDPGEGGETALKREAREEIGAEVGPPSLLASFPNSYTFAGVWYHTCDFYYAAELLTPPELLTPDPKEVTRILWLDPRQVDPEDLAFPALKAFWRFLLTSGRLG
jgi:ADP-ribose pyrophosphatase YjhB (NUDIX family)